MRGNCNLIRCQICQTEMSFGRIQRHIKIQHREINYNNYVKKYWSTLPLHQPCEVCKDKIVYKYKTCSKECRSQLEHGQKGKPKPKGFITEKHKEILRNRLIGKPGLFTNHKHSEKTKQTQRENCINNKPHKGYSQSDFQKFQASKGMLKYYAQGNEPWTKNNKHTPETIKKIFSYRKMNKLEKLVSNIFFENKIEYEFQHVLQYESKCKVYDFKIKNILIEIDGDYYHGGPGCVKYYHKVKQIQTNDLFKNTLAKENGFKLIRIWESEIKSNPNIVIEKLNGSL